MDDQEHKIIIDEEKCTGCGVCVDYCHGDAIGVSEQKSVVEVLDLDFCIVCHSCQQNCPEGAIKVYPQIEESMKDL